MAFVPCGSDAWPETVLAQRRSQQAYGATLRVDWATPAPVLFHLIWYYNGDRTLDGFHNVRRMTPKHLVLKDYYLSPAYNCSVCNQVLLIPFPEVEKENELHHFLMKHLENCS